MSTDFLNLAINNTFNKRIRRGNYMSWIKKYDMNGIHDIYKTFAKNFNLKLPDAVKIKEYLDLIIQYKLCKTQEHCKLVISIFKTLYPNISKYVFKIIIEKNEDLDEIKEKKALYNSIAPNELGNESLIYKMFKKENKDVYKILMAKKFSLSLYNIIKTLNKISINNLAYINHKFYCFNYSYWSDDPKIIKNLIQDLLITHYVSEAKRINYKFNIAKLYNYKFITRIFNHYTRHKSLMSENIKLDQNKNHHVFFTNFIIGIPKIHVIKAVSYNCSYYNTASTNYDFRAPKEKHLNNIKLLFELLIPERPLQSSIPDENTRITLLNLCCSSIIYQGINLLVVLRGESDVKNLFIELMLAMLGSYGISLDASMLNKTSVLKKLINQKRFVIFRNYQEPINNEELETLFNLNQCSTFFLDTTDEPRFQNKLNYYLTKKIIEFTFPEDTYTKDKYTELIGGSLRKFINEHKFALFRIIFDHCSLHYKHHTCNMVWYNENVDNATKLSITKYQDYNKN